MNFKYLSTLLLGLAIAIIPLAKAQDTVVPKKSIHEFDAFLDARPKLGSELTHNPSLIKDQNFINNNPELANFMQSHTEIGEQLKANPESFMQGIDLYRKQIADFHVFLNAHPQMRNDFANNPQLANDAAYVQKHPGLQTFLQHHPGIKAELQTDPANFINREKGYEKWLAERNAPPSGQTDAATLKQVHEFDAFLDPHPQMGSEITRSPALVTDATYLKNHPELVSFLNSHSDVKQELTGNPQAFVDKLSAYRSAVAEFDKFLKSHPDINNDLASNPQLANDPTYLTKHSELKAYLDGSAGVKAELQTDPANFMYREKGYRKWMASRGR